MKIVHELDRKAWSDFVYKHPHGNIFQTPEMYDVYMNTKNYDPLFLGVLSDDGEILATLLAVVQSEYNSIINALTKRSIILGGPLVKDDDESVYMSTLIGYDRVIGRTALYSQFRNLWDVSKNKHLFVQTKYVHDDHLNIAIDLSKPEDLLWKEVHSKRRNEIRRARKEGTYVRELVQVSDVEVMYEILRGVYSSAKLPIADRSMFMAAFEILRPRGLCRYFGAFNNGDLIGAICVLTYKKCIYDWYAGSLKQYFSKYPNDLLPWEVFRWGKEHGYLLFDFGGAGKPDKDYGVRDYKKKFGGVFSNYGRFEKVHKSLEYTIARAGFKVWQFFRS